MLTIYLLSSSTLLPTGSASRTAQVTGAFGQKWWWGDNPVYDVGERSNDEEIFSQEYKEGEDGGDKEKEQDGDDPDPPCPDHVRSFAYQRVDWKSFPGVALQPGKEVNHLYWPDFIVEESNPTFFTGPYHRRPKVVFWAPAIFWPR